MKKNKVMYYYKLYKETLLNQIVPFWINNGLDRKNGGLFTCLDRQGSLYNTDKSVWFQGRATWMFSRLYNTLRKPEWLDIAEDIYTFLSEHCFDSDGRMYFTVTHDGMPLQKRRYMFSEIFAVIACAEYAKASGKDSAFYKAKEIYGMCVDLYRHPKKMIPKIIPETRRTKALALPMSLLSTTQSLRDICPDPEYNELAKEFVSDILCSFYKPSEKALFEHVGPEGERLDSPQGRCINPGHSIETAWFILHEGLYQKDRDIIESALEILNYSLEIRMG